MSEREEVAKGSVSWIDLWTSDVEGSREFYSRLFDWRAEEPSEEFGDYWMFTRGGVPIAGGMGDMGDIAAKDTWKIYLATPDAAATAHACERLGATILVAPAAVADMGIQAVLRDVCGATVGIWQPLSFPGFTTFEEHGSPCWFELYARDDDAAVAFYRDAFDLETAVMSEGEFRYTTLSARGREVAGVFDAAGSLPEGASAHWVVYWQVDDIDLAVERVRELGGRVLSPAEASPYGRIATVADRAGAEFKLRASPSRD